MSQNINDNFLLNAPKSIDSRYGKISEGATTAYASTTEANAAVNINDRYLGLTVLITVDDVLGEYWYSTGTADEDLVLKETGGGGVIFDSTPTADSTNAVTSGGTKSYVDNSIPSFIIINNDPFGDICLGYDFSVTDTDITITPNNVPIKLGDVLCYKDPNTNALISLTQTTQIPVPVSWTSAKIGEAAGITNTSMPNYVFEATLVGDIVTLDPSTNSTGTEGQIAYGQINGLDGSPNSDSITIYGGYFYYHSGTWNNDGLYPAIYSIGGSQPLPYITNYTNLPYNVKEILVQIGTFQGFDSTGSANPTNFDGDSLGIADRDVTLPFNVSTQTIDDGEMLEKVLVVDSNNPIVSVGTTNGGSDIYDPVQMTGGQLILAGDVYFANSATIYINGVTPNTSLVKIFKR